MYSQSFVPYRWWYGGLVFTLTHRDYQVRQQAKTCFSKLCSLAEDGSVKLQILLLEKFRELLQNQEVCFVVVLRWFEFRGVT